MQSVRGIPMDCQPVAGPKERWVWWCEACPVVNFASAGYAPTYRLALERAGGHALEVHHRLRGSG